MKFPELNQSLWEKMFCFPDIIAKLLLDSGNNVLKVTLLDLCWPWEIKERKKGWGGKMTICPAECGQDSWAPLPQQTFLVDISLALDPLGHLFTCQVCLIRLCLAPAVVVCATFKPNTHTYTLVHRWWTHSGLRETRAHAPLDKPRNVTCLFIHFIINNSLPSLDLC